MGLKNLLVYSLLLATASAQSLNDPWLRDPLLVGLWKLTRAINCFGFNLFDDLSMTNEGNLLICPYALSNSLGVLHFASFGKTEKELAGILGYEAFNLTRDEAAQTFYMLSTKQLQSSNPKFYIFDAPITILVNRNNGLFPTFQRMVEVLFQAPITVANFMESAEELRRSLNYWVAARTRHRIKNIIEIIDPYSDMVLLSAAFFKGVWIHKFKRQETRTGTFYNYGSTSNAKEVDMMRMTNILKYHKDLRHSTVELPFKGRNVSMMIFLPNSPDGIDELQYEFSPEFLEEQILKMKQSDVNIVLPKFRIEFGADLTNSLIRMGADTLFYPESVDLSGMLRRDSVVLGDIGHQTTVSVAENGIEATVATAMDSVKSFPPVLEAPDFHADHPFLFVLYERRIKMILFMSRVVEL